MKNYSSDWKNINDSLEIAKNILIKNQYPSTFFDQIINKTLTKIIESQSTPIGLNESVQSNESSDDVDDCSESDEVHNNNSIQTHVHYIEEKDTFRLFIHYRGKCRE